MADDRDNADHRIDQAEDAGEDEGFLSRWSRRKRQAHAGLNPPEPSGEAAQTPEQLAEAGSPPAVTDADMPPVESLDESSDFSPFLSPGVSEQLRKRALRKLFGFSGFNFRDGLDDYDDDYTVFEPLGDIITADMRAQLEREARRRGEAELAQGDAAATGNAESDRAPASRSTEADGLSSTTEAATDAPSTSDDSRHG